MAGLAFVLYIHFYTLVSYLLTKMIWLTSSEAEVWEKVYKKHRKETVAINQIKKEVKTRALKEKLFALVRKRWVMRLSRGEYYVPAFDEIMEKRFLEINSLEDVKDKGKLIPLVLGLPATSRIYWYPIKKPQSLYANERYHQMIKTRYVLKTLKEGMMERSLDVDGVRMLSLEDTIVESLLDGDVQAAMALAHRNRELVDWDYLLSRVREEHVESAAYVSLERFPIARELKEHYVGDVPRLSDFFVEKALRENTVYAMRHN